MNRHICKKISWYDALLLIVLLLITAWYMMPIVQSYIRSKGFIVLAICYILITIFYNKSIALKYIVISILLIISLNMIYIGTYRNREYFTQMLSLLYFFFPIFPALFLFEAKKYNVLKIMAMASLLMMGLTLLTTMAGLVHYPEAARALATSRVDLYDIEVYKRMNIGGYGFIYAIVFSSYIYFYLFRISKINIVVLIIILSSIGFVIYKSQYTMALLFIILILCTSIFIKKPKLYQLILLITLFSVSIYYGSQILGEVFKELSNIISIDAISIRMNEISNYFLFNDIDSTSDLGMRLQLYKNSLESFFNSPFLGTIIYGESTNYCLGHHSEILDLLGGMGIIGIIPVISIFSFYKKIVISKFKINMIFTNWVWFVSFIFIFSTINTLFSSFELGFLLFLLIPSTVSLGNVKTNFNYKNTK